jgi:hypothetical protein
MKNSKHQSSISKRLEASAGSFGVFKRGLTQKKELVRDATPRNAALEIQAAQKILAQIAVRIMTEKVPKTDEQE